MFNKPATGLFGGAANTSFGATGTSFGTGTTPFGTTGFGSTGFGTQPTNSGLFGGSAAAPASVAGGLFGGGSSTFGPTAATNTGFSFGTATATVQPTVQSVAGAGGLFGAPTSGFGVTATQPASLFGNASQPMGGSTFGAQPNAAGSLFGGASFLGAGSAGTTGTVIKFVPVPGTDIIMKGGSQQSVATKLQCITGMKEYENKSLEELRLEDYAVNRKGPQQGQQQQQTGLGFLGSTAQTTTTQAPSAFGVFGQPTKPAFSGFGATGTTGTSTSLFGQPQAQQTTGGSLFGASSQPKSLFGTTTTTTTASPFGGLTNNTSLFGQNNAAKPGLFGATPSTQSTGLFGSTTATASGVPGFGTSGFGSGNTFGTGATTGGLFGQKPTGFGATATAQPTSFNFGQTQQQQQQPGAGILGTTGLFGTKATAANTGFNFGQTTNTGFTGTLGGSTAPFGGGGLGLNLGGLGGSSLFQQSQAKPVSTGLGFTGFGGTGMVSGLNLGNANAAALGLTGGLGGGGGTSADLAAALLQQQQQVQQHLQVLNSSPYGDSPLFRNLKQDPARKDELLRPTNPEAQKATLAASSQLKVTNRLSYKIKPKSLQSIITGKGQLFDGLEEDESNVDAETFVPRRSFKKLVIRNSSGTGGGGGGGASTRGSNSPPSASVDSDLALRDSLGNSGGAKSTEASRDKQVGGDHDGYNYAAHRNRDRLIAVNDNNQQQQQQQQQQHHHDSYSQHDDDDDGYSNTEYENSYNIGNNPENAHADLAANNPTGVLLHRPDYYTLPSLSELVELMDENGACWVENFVVGRDGYGNVVFPGLTNVTGLNLDEIVHFRSKEIDVYPNDEKKPAIGEGLNRKAQVTLDRIWPTDKTSGYPIKDYDRLLAMNYLEKLEQVSHKIGAKFIDYRHETGSWVFEVKHFSKYGLLDDSDEDEDMMQAPAGGNKNLPQQQQQPKQPLPTKLTPANQQQVTTVQQTSSFGSIDDARKDLREKIMEGSATVGEEDTEMSDTGRHSDQMFHSKKILGSGETIDDEELEEEEDEEEDDEDDDDDDVPSSVCLAKSLGVSAAQVQLQKASFFGIDDDNDDDFQDDETYLYESPFAQKKKKPFGVNADVRFGLFPSDKQLHQKRRSVSPPQKMFVDPSSAAAGVRGGAGDSPTKRFQTPAEGSAYQESAFRKLVPHHQQQQQHPSFAHPLVPSAPTVDRRTTFPRLRSSVAMDFIIPYGKSLFAEKQHLLMDVGLVHSMRSRVGWTRDWTFAHCGAPLHTVDDGDEDDDNDGNGVESRPSRFIGSMRRSEENLRKRKQMSSAQVLIESINISADTSASTKAITDLLNECLHVELEHSHLKSQKDFPLFAPSNGLKLLHSYSEKVQTPLASSSSSSCDLANLMSVTLALCMALWGDLQLAEEFTEDTYVCQRARKVSLAHWLTTSSERTIEREVERNNAKGAGDEGAAAVVFSYLTGGLIEKACEHALANQNDHLALLIAQAIGSEDCKTMIRLQLAMWADTSMDNFIDTDYLRLYALLAGTLVWKSSDQLINTCAQLDWKRCLAVHLSFMCPGNTSVLASLKEYENAFTGQSVHGIYAAPPRPSYMEELGLDDRDVLDVCYHLLKLYCDRTHPLHVLLNPSTMSGNQLDYSLSWHLLQVLASLGYNHLSNVHQGMICTNYASQLESLGFWHWAVFVLLHIHDDNSRSNAVHQLLVRHVCLDDSKQDNAAAKEDFVVNNLHIPPELIHLAKAIRAKSEGRHFEEAWHLLKARKWNQCHDVIITSVAPEAIVNENYDMLQVLLRMLADPEVTCHIEDWNTGGRLYVDYIDMIDKLQHMKQPLQQGQSSEMESLYDMASSLGTRINSMLCNNHLDSVCQAMISKRITDVMTMRMGEHPTERDLRLSADLLSSLPLPEDFALETLAQMSHYTLQAMLS